MQFQQRIRRELEVSDLAVAESAAVEATELETTVEESLMASEMLAAQIAADRVREKIAQQELCLPLVASAVDRFHYARHSLAGNCYWYWLGSCCFELASLATELDCYSMTDLFLASSAMELGCCSLVQTVGNAVASVAFQALVGHSRSCLPFADSTKISKIISRLK